MARWQAWIVLGALGCAPSDDGGGASGSATESGLDGGDTAQDSTGAELPLVELKTSVGNLLLELRPDLAPGTVANFVAYIDSGFYDGSDGQGPTIIHRVIPGFVIQMGGLTDALSAKSVMAPIVSEAGGLTNERGTVAMALTPGDVDSASSQFFINVTDNPELDVAPAFTAFATVALGMDLVDTISVVDTEDASPYSDVPVVPIVIESITVL